MGRAENIEVLKRHMEGREALETVDADGHTVRLYHDQGLLGVRIAKPGAPADYHLIESAPENALSQLVLEALKDKIRGQTLDITGLDSITGIALGSSAAGAKPGFPGAVLIGEAKPGETPEQLLERVAREKGEDPRAKYFDPKRNPFIPGSTAPRPEPAPKDRDKDKDKYCDPARNPLIKT